MKPWRAWQWFVDHRDAVAEFVQGVCSDEAHRYHRGALALAKKMKL